MLKLAEEAPKDFDDKTSGNDIFSQVMGSERNGYLCMYGLGVRPYDVFGPIPSKSTSYMHAMELKEEVEALKVVNEEVQKELQELQSTFQNGGQNGNANFSIRTNVGSSISHNGDTQ